MLLDGVVVMIRLLVGVWRNVSFLRGTCTFRRSLDRPNYSEIRDDVELNRIRSNIRSPIRSQTSYCCSDSSALVSLRLLSK